MRINLILRQSRAPFSFEMVKRSAAHQSVVARPT
jgi:hypothetical protein